MKKLDKQKDEGISLNSFSESYYPPFLVKMCGEFIPISRHAQTINRSYHE